MILISSKPALLFRTIVARCQPIVFHPLKRDQLKDILYRDFGLHTNLSHFLAYYCEGSLGSALTLKDTDILARKNIIVDAFALGKRVDTKSLNLIDREEIRSALHILD